jgi:hypothetical protein
VLVLADDVGEQRARGCGVRDADAASSGARRASPSTRARRGPSSATTCPPGIPSAKAGRVWQARTSPIFVVDPVVARTNQGSATIVMFVPVSEMKRAETTAASVRSRSMAI